MDEELRFAVEDTIREGLAASGGTWTATLPDGKEVEFRPTSTPFSVTVCDEDGDEKDYKFRVVVELVQ